MEYSETQFDGYKIGNFDCNINRAVKNLPIFTDFDHAVPHYDKTSGLHLKFKSSVVPLRSEVIDGMLIKDISKMTYEEAAQKFAEAKKPIVESLIKRTFAMGYQNPSPIQTIGILPLIQKNDVLVQFKSGTGKSLTFLFGLFWGFDPYDEKLQYVIITSSHEVANQLYDTAKNLLSVAKIALCIGRGPINNNNNNSYGGAFKQPIGTSSLNSGRKTLKELQDEARSAQIIICTMGKFYEYCIDNKKRIIDTKFLKAICIDEFDGILKTNPRASKNNIMSTADQVDDIMKYIPPTAQRVFFSATVTQDSLKIAHGYFRKYNQDIIEYYKEIGRSPEDIEEPFIILLDINDYTLDGIKQYYHCVRSYLEKLETLYELLKNCRISQCIIFSNRIDTAKQIKDYLDKQSGIKFTSSLMHSTLSATEREDIRQKFIRNEIRLLVSTDLTSRGFDAQSVNLVICFDMPEDIQTYIHRIGRSGRFGKKGVSISFILVDPYKQIDEMQKVKDIDSHSVEKMKPLPQDLSNLEDTMPQTR